MTGLRDAFRRDAKLQQNKITRFRLHWRHTEREWEVVSTSLTDWENATHPKNHDSFRAISVGDVGEGITRFRPDNSDEWETFTTEEEVNSQTIDEYAYNDFVKTLKNEVAYLNAKKVAQFLTGTHTVTYNVDLGANDCQVCNGTGTVCAADECYTYCTNDSCGSSNQTLRVSDDACSCSSCNYEDHWEQCDNCDGEGKIEQGNLTRTFPFNRDQILSEMPSKKKLQAIQFTLNKLANHAEDNNTFVSPMKVLQLFDLVEHDKHEKLVSQALSYIEPTLPTETIAVRNDDGKIVTDEDCNPVYKERVLPDQREKAALRIKSAMFDVSPQEAKQISV